jgi:hypothetical protein
MTAWLKTVIPGIVRAVPTDDRRTWGILRGRRSAKSLWIVPELWKNAQNAFSHKLVGRADAPTRSTGVSLLCL